MKTICVIVGLLVVADLVYLTDAVQELGERTRRISTLNLTVNEVATRRQVLTEKSELSELEGVLTRNIKWTSPYTLRTDGNGVRECYLTGAVLEGIADGTHIRAKGRLTTYRYPVEADTPAVSCFPLHWGILMHVEEVTMTPDPFRNSPLGASQHPAAVGAPPQP